MAKTLVALDIGTHAVKGVVLEKDFRSFEVKKWAYIPIDRGEGPVQPEEHKPEETAAPDTADAPETNAAPKESAILEETVHDEMPAFTNENGTPPYADAVARFLEEVGPFADDGLSVALSGSDVLTRFVSLPFTGRKVAQVLEFEVEGDVPFDLDEYVIEHQVLDTTDGTSRVLATLATRDEIASQLSDLAHASLNPSVLTPDFLTYADLIHVLVDPTVPGTDGAAAPLANQLSDTEALAVIDIGASKTNVGIFAGPDAEVVSVRTIPLAGDVITGEIAREFGLAWTDAEQGKVRDGCVLNGNAVSASQDKRRVSDTIQSALTPLIRELALTLRTAAAQGTPVARVLLCGGTSILPGLKEYLTDRLGLKVEPVPFPEALKPTDAPPPVDPAVFVQSVALSLVPITRTVRVNFRTGEFVFRSEAQAYKTKLFVPIALTIALIVALLASFMSTYQLNQKKVAVLEVEQAVVFQAALAGETMVPGKGLSQMETRKGEMTRLLSAAGVLKGMSPLAVMTILAQNLPPELDIKVNNLRVEKDGAHFSGLTHNYEALDFIKSKLSERPEFEKVTIADSRPGVEEGSIKFKITIDFAAETDEPAAPTGAAGGR